MALTLGMTPCKLYHALPVATKTGIPVGLSDGDQVLCAGEGGGVVAPHANNGVYTVHAGAWVFESWDPATVRAPQIEVGPEGGAVAGLYRLVRIGSGTRVDRI